MSPLGIIDAVHGAERTVVAFVALVAFVCAPLGFSLAVALVRRQRGGA